MEHLKACAEIATQRTVNWQKFCIKDDCEFCLCRVWGSSGVKVGILDEEAQHGRGDTAEGFDGTELFPELIIPVP